MAHFLFHILITIRVNSPQLAANSTLRKASSLEAAKRLPFFSGTYDLSPGRVQDHLPTPRQPVRKKLLYLGLVGGQDLPYPGSERANVPIL
jgi:hypothetical protein